MAYRADAAFVAEMVMAMKRDHSSWSVAQDWSSGVDYGGNWVIKLVSAKYNAVEATWRVLAPRSIWRRFRHLQQVSLNGCSATQLGRIHPSILLCRTSSWPGPPKGSTRGRAATLGLVALGPSTRF
jgi:hypothetical protein